MYYSFTPPPLHVVTSYIDDILMNLSLQDLSETKRRTLSQLYDYLSNLCNITFSADEVKFSADERHTRYATFLIAMSSVALCYPSLERETVARIVAPLNTYQVSILQNIKSSLMSSLVKTTKSISYF